jgi:hypothetical protein
MIHQKKRSSWFIGPPSTETPNHKHRPRMETPNRKHQIPNKHQAPRLHPALRQVWSAGVPPAVSSARCKAAGTATPRSPQVWRRAPNPQKKRLLPIADRCVLDLRVCALGLAWDLVLEVWSLELGASLPGAILVILPCDVYRARQDRGQQATRGRRE